MSDSGLSEEQVIEQMANVHAREAKLERFSYDVTDSKKLQEGLKQLYRSIMENAHVAIALMDLDYKILIANKTIGEKFNKPVRDLIGRECFREFEKRETICPHCPGKVAIATGQPAEAEGEGVCSDGSCFPVRIQAFPAIDPSGAMTGFVEIVEDITERKRAEQALRESEEKFRSLAEQSPNMIFINRKGKIIYANKKCEDVIGYKREELCSPDFNFIDLIAPESVDLIKDNFDRHLRGEEVQPYDYSLVNKQGEKIEVINASKLIRYEGEMAILGIVTDISNRKQTEQKLLEDRAQLKSLASQLSLTEERERREIATELHDRIGQSLVISKIKLDQLRKSVSSEELTEALGEICDCLEQVIQDTRTLTFDLSSPILYELGFEAAVAEWLHEQIQEKYGIKTEFEDDQQPKPLDDDIRILLFRNVRELLINAVKHSKARNVKVSVRRAGERIIIKVEDDGVGFDPVEAASKAAERATFGLFSIRERLEQLEGHLEIESAPGRGSWITMTAPLKCKKF